jgi:hypothetical protein
LPFHELTAHGCRVNQRPRRPVRHSTDTQID